MSISKISELLQRQQQLSQQLQENQTELKNVCQQIKKEDISDLDYEALFSLYKEIKSFIDKDVNIMISDILRTKKIIKYPQLQKPTYYPEIDNLKITDSEKLRLDKAARYNSQYYIRTNNLGRLQHKLSIEDLEMLTEIGIATKYYDFQCDECGGSSKRIADEDLKRYKRTWTLEKKKIASQLTIEESEELDYLYDDGFYTILLTCMDDDDFYMEISCKEELKEYADNIDVVYKITKSPDLTYENL